MREDKGLYSTPECLAGKFLYSALEWFEAAAGIRRKGFDYEKTHSRDPSSNHGRTACFSINIF
jgi:hypothetical protein